jgi:hypothetical protein
MARLQILELPAGPDDARPPFVLVVDQTVPQRAVLSSDTSWRDPWQDLADKIGARGVIVTPDTVEIPANDTTAHLDTSGSAAPEALDPELAALVLETLGIEMEPGGTSCAEMLFRACRELQTSEAARARLLSERKEARVWARHGYEIGQRHCGWSEHGVAPAWLTEGWPTHFDSCEHLKRAGEYDTALSRVLEVAAELEAAEAHGGAWDANQQAARCIRAAVGRPRDDEVSGS